MEIKRCIFWVIFCFGYFEIFCTTWHSGYVVARYISAQDYCDNSTPCGWADYNPYTKVITDRQRNYICICKPTQQCYLIEDVTAYSYYIYGCRDEDPEENSAAE